MRGEGAGAITRGSGGSWELLVHGCACLSAEVGDALDTPEEAGAGLGFPRCWVLAACAGVGGDGASQGASMASVGPY